MSATDKLEDILTEIPALASYITLYRICGVSDEEILARLKAVVEEVARERL